MRKKIEADFKIPYNPNEEHTSGNMYQFLAVICLIPAMIYRSKPFFWVAVFSILSSIFNKKRNESYFQLMMPCGMLIMNFYSLYIHPPQLKPPSN